MTLVVVAGCRRGRSTGGRRSNGGRLVRGLVRIDDGVDIASGTKSTFGGVQSGGPVVVSQVGAQPHWVHVVSSAGESVVEVHAVRHQVRLLMVKVRRGQDAVGGGEQKGEIKFTYVTNCQ